MAIHLSEEQVQELADHLSGTSQSLEHACDVCFNIETDDATDTLDLNTLDRLDELVFECTVCNWWASNDELAESDGDNICLECAGDDEEEET